jgi:hypothetical protein
MAPTNDGDDGTSADKAPHLNGESSLVDGPASSTKATASATNTPIVDDETTSKIYPSKPTSDQTPEKDKSILEGEEEEEAGVSSLSPTAAGDNLKAVSSPLITKTGENTEKDSSNIIKDGICVDEAKAENEKNSGDAVSLETPSTAGGTKPLESEPKLPFENGKGTAAENATSPDGGPSCQSSSLGNEEDDKMEDNTSAPTHESSSKGLTAAADIENPDGGSLCQSSSLGNEEDDKMECKISASTSDSSSKGLPATTEIEKQEKVALPSTTTTKEGEKPSNESASLLQNTTPSVPSAKKSNTDGTEEPNGKKGDFSEKNVASMPKQKLDSAPESDKEEGKAKKSNTDGTEEPKGKKDDFSKINVASTPKQTSDSALESDKEEVKAMESNAYVAKSEIPSLDSTTRKQQTAPTQIFEVDSSDDSLLGSAAITKKKKKNPTTSLAAKPPSKTTPIEIAPPDTHMTDAFASNAQSENKDKPLISEPPLKPSASAYEIAEQTTESVRTQHKQMLLKLFLNVDKETLRGLKDQCDNNARPAETMRLSEEQSTNNRRRERTRSPSNISLFPREANLGLLPAALQEFQDVCKQHASIKRPSLIIEDSKKRKSYSSRSLQDLEHLVNANFLESKLYKDISRETLASPNQQHPENIVTPFALEYNECSISAITRWGRKGSAGKTGKPPENSKTAWTDTMQHDRPAVSALFRKCTVCSRYGHYEIECNELLKNETALLALAQKTKMQGITRELLEKGKDPHDLNFRHVGYEKVREKEKKDVGEEEPPDDDLSRKYFGCELCHSGADDDNMLICDGCDKLFHLYCLDPPLEKVPDGDWFCLKCEVSTRDVDSDVEIEACDDFVIEQRKKPCEDKILSKEKGFGFAKDDGWNTAMAVVGDDVNAMPGDDGGLRPRAKRLRNLAYREEEAEIDGFVITAKATSDSLDVARRIKASYDMPAEDMSKAPLVTGSIVLWFSTTFLEDEEEVKTTNETSEEPAVMVVGTVLAVDAVSREALVRPIPQWKQMILDFRAENDSDHLSRLEECAMRAVSSASTVWVPTESLHMVAREPPGDAKATFSEILPERIAYERNKRDPSNLVPQLSQQKARVR